MYALNHKLKRRQKEYSKAKKTKENRSFADLVFPCCFLRLRNVLIVIRWNQLLGSGVWFGRPTDEPMNCCEEASPFLS